MDKPTKTGYYWFRGIMSWRRGVRRPISEPVSVDPELEVVYLMDGVDEGWRLDSFEGEWKEITEEFVFGKKDK